MDKENQTLKIRKRIEKLKSSVTGEVGCSVVLHYVVCLVIFWSVSQPRLLTTLLHCTLPLN